MSSITFKGSRNGLIFYFQPGFSFADYYHFLQSSFSENPQLFSDSQVQFAGEGLAVLSCEERIELQKLCLLQGLPLENLHCETPEPVPVSQNPAPIPETEPAPPAFDGITIFKTVRSGQRCYTDGTLLIYGNVNESAEIMAGGDIVVLGRLEGVAHAGCNGREDSFIFALSLNAQQIRIASHVSRAGEDEAPGNNYPEIACIENGAIEIRPYDARTLF